jgi:ribonuclease P protein component
VPTLRLREDFARISATGRTRSDRLMVLRFVPNGRDHDRFGISTSRRLGGAVRRNRIRRRLREALRLRPEGGGGFDVLIVARPASAEASFDDLRASVGRLLGMMRESADVPS